MPINLNEWSQAVVYERLTEARERRLAAQVRVQRRRLSLRGWLAWQMMKLGYRLDRRVCRRAASVCESR